VQSPPSELSSSLHETLKGPKVAASPFTDRAALPNPQVHCATIPYPLYPNPQGIPLLHKLSFPPFSVPSLPCSPQLRPIHPMLTHRQLVNSGENGSPPSTDPEGLLPSRPQFFPFAWHLTKCSTHPPLLFRSTHLITPTFSPLQALPQHYASCAPKLIPRPTFPFIPPRTAFSPPTMVNNLPLVGLVHT